ncbi:MAG: hypothetical protein RMK94_06120 [Armatimonadota bacterium]|nr:hypothetical protein [Armatimonadota bacterium]
MKGKEYAKRIFDRKPAWAEALEGETKGEDEYDGIFDVGRKGWEVLL